MTRGDPDRILDLLVVGGGLAGLSAAYRQRHRDVLVPDAGSRPGGRLLSHDRGHLWLNLGAHMFAGRGTPVGDLVAELGLQTGAIQGALMGMSFRGSKVLNGRPELLPLRLPLSPAARLSFLRMGVSLRLGAAGMSRAIRAGDMQAMAYEDDRTLADRIGPLHPDAAAILTAITERSGGDPSEMSAGHALRSFVNVWDRTAPGGALIGGGSRLVEALCREVGDSRVLGEVQVTDVRQTGDHVTVQAVSPQGPIRLRARHCVVAVPAMVARSVVQGLPTETAAALDRISYGPFLSVALLARASTPMPWTGTYGLATPDGRFSVLFNQSTPVDQDDRDGRDSLMLFCGARRATAMMAQSDSAIEAAAMAHILQLFPRGEVKISDIVIQRWEAGAPVALPGRATVQDNLMRPLGRIALAGDYLQSPNMNAAIASSDRALALLGLQAITDQGIVMLRPSA